MAITHLVAALCDLHIHFEVVASAAKWADSVSRNLYLDDVAREHGFPLEEAKPDTELYQASY